MVFSRSEADRIIERFGLAKYPGSLEDLRLALQHAYKKGHDDGYEDGLEDANRARA